MSQRRYDEAQLWQQLKRRAQLAQTHGGGVIAGGEPGEPVLQRWELDGMQCVVRPNDPQGILRISIGGGPELPGGMGYCTIRGDKQQCIELLTRALQALQAGP